MDAKLEADPGTEGQELEDDQLYCTLNDLFRYDIIYRNHRLQHIV